MLRITGGKVYDPANGIDGVVKDICIADGRIAAEVEGGRTSMPPAWWFFPAAWISTPMSRAARSISHVG